MECTTRALYFIILKSYDWLSWGGYKYLLESGRRKPVQIEHLKDYDRDGRKY
jgi:hypothetical protein